MKSTIIIIAVILGAGFLFWDNIEGALVKRQTIEKQDKKKDKDISGTTQFDLGEGLSIKDKWELPEILKEISGLAYIDDQRFACIQDEDGTIFIYNTGSREIEKEIPFGGPGDYEGITVKGNTAYVVRADGKLFQIDLNGDKNSVKEYGTDLTINHNVEGLCYDENKNRLLLAIKNDEPGNKNYKGIYAFDLSANKFVKEPAFRIDTENEMLKSTTGKKNKSIMPSAISINPVTKDIFITDGPKSRLLIMDSDGNIKKLVELGKDFAQPEGLTFNARGELFISNEGAKQPGNIIKVIVE